MLGRHRLCWKELVECMVWIVLNFVEQFFVTLLQQGVEFRQVRRAEAASPASTQKRISSLAVCRGNESAPCWWRVCQPRHDNCAEDSVQAGLCHPMMPQCIVHGEHIGTERSRWWLGGDGRTPTSDLWSSPQGFWVSYHDGCRAAVAVVRRKLHHRISGVNRPQVSGYDGICCWSDARPLYYAGWNACRRWFFPVEHRAVSVSPAKKSTIQL